MMRQESGGSIGNNNGPGLGGSVSGCPGTPASTSTGGGSPAGLGSGGPGLLGDSNSMPSTSMEELHALHHLHSSQVTFSDLY